LYIFQYFEDKNILNHFFIRDLRTSLWWWWRKRRSLLLSWLWQCEG